MRRAAATVARFVGGFLPMWLLAIGVAIVGITEGHQASKRQREEVRP